MPIDNPTTPQVFDYTGADIVVVDGDTIRLTLTKTIDMGFGIVQGLRQQGVRIRLAGMDAKPLKTPQGDAAARWLVNEITSAPVIRVVTVKNVLGEDKHEKYGRYLAFLYRADVGTFTVPSINELMIAAGMAAPWDGRGPHPTSTALGGTPK